MFRANILSLGALLSQVICAYGQAALSQQTCAVDGIVKDASTGTTIARANVKISQLLAETEAVGEAQRRHLGRAPESGGLQMVSDSEGRFCFQAPVSGQFSISASKRGFADGAYGAGNPFESGAILTTGSSRRLMLMLFPYASISGRVLDSDNEPVDGGFVQIYARAWMRGAYRYFPVKQVQLDDLGGYRVGNLSPGTYFVAFRPAANTGRSGLEEAGPKRPRPIRTFYPNTAGMSEAVGIELKAGDQIPNVDVRCRQALTYDLRGTLTGSVDKSGFSAISIAPDDEDPVSLMLSPGNLAPNGTFHFPSLTPGSYRLTYVSGPTVARGTVTVGEQDVNDARLEVSAPVSVRGRIRMDSADRVDLSSVRMELSSSEAFIAPTYVARVDPTGAFVFDGVSPGRYLMTVTPPAGTYLKAVRYGQTEVLMKEFYVGGDGGEVGIDLRRGTAQIDGRLGGGGTTPASTSAYYLLVPSLLAPDGTGVRFGHTNENGAFSAADLPPGRYRAYALASMDYATVQIPSVLKAMESSGAVLDLEEGDRTAVTLHVLSSEEIRRIAGDAAR